MVQHFNDSNFDQEVLHSDVPVMVDFYADWCGPCRMVSPIVEELAFCQKRPGRRSDRRCPPQGQNPATLRAIIRFRCLQKAPFF